MRNQNKIMVKCIVLCLIICFSKCQDSITIANTFSQNFSDLNTQLSTLLTQSQQLNNQKSSATNTVALNTIAQTIAKTNKSLGVGNQMLGMVTSLYKAYTTQNPQTQLALKALQKALNGLAGQISNVKSEILNAINALDKNSAMRNIDDSVSLLTSFVTEYSSTSEIDLLSFKQMCGGYFQICNQAFVSLAQGLTDYITTIKVANGWSKTDVLTNYVIHASLLLSSMTALSDLNLQLAIDQLNVSYANLTTAQKQAFSQSQMLYDSYIKSYNMFSQMYPQLYDTYYVNVKMEKNSYNDFLSQSNYLVNGIYRTLSGDGVDAIKQIKVGEKEIILQNVLITPVQSTLDKDNSWAVCPTNSFLRGIRLSDGYKVYHIEELVCNTYKNTYYDQCENTAVPGFSSVNQWAKCNDGKFLVGIYRGNGENINNISYISCCSITSTRPAFLSYTDSLQFIKTQYRPSKTNIDMTNGSKQPIQYFNIKQAQLQGDLEVGIRSGFTIDSTKDIDVLKTFDDPLKNGSCPQDYFMYGIYQNDGTTFSHIEKILCVKYKNQFWGQCFGQVIPTDTNYWKCRNNDECKSSVIPTQARCQDGFMLTGFRRNSLNNMHGLDRITCCSASSQSGLFKN